MKRTYAMAAVCLVLATGVAVPGCFLFGSAKDKGRICASPVEGGTYCVPSSYAASSAWGDAKAAGSEPIQMWAEWPENISIDQLVQSDADLHAWYENIDDVTFFLRDEKGNAESYHASMAGKMGQLLRQAREAQNNLLFAKSADPKKRITKMLLAKAVKETDPLKAEITADKQTMGDVQIVFDQANVDAGPYATQYKKLVDAFTSYHATEAMETSAYTTLAKDASKATLVELAGVEVSILDAAHAASANPSELIATAMKLSAQILQFEKDSQEAISTHLEFMSAHGATSPDLSSGALRSIHAMLGYLQQRVMRSDATAKGLLFGVGMRRQALQLLETAPSPARTTIANALLAKASTKFTQTASVRVDALNHAASNSGKAGLPYLAKRYDEFAALLQMAPLCDGSTTSWRETGCVSMRPKFKDAAQYLKTTLPDEITQGLATLKNQGVDAAVIERVQKKLKAGDIKGAALAHDELLRSTEGT